MGFSVSAHRADVRLKLTLEAPEQHTLKVGKVGNHRGKNPTLLAKYPIVINLHISNNFRIFVTEKEIVIRKFTIKTPDRWAKRQSIMRNMEMSQNTMKDLGTLNRGQSILLGLYFKGFTHAQLSVYTTDIEVVVYIRETTELTIAEMIIRNLMADGDYIEISELENEDGPFTTIKWHGNLIEIEKA